MDSKILDLINAAIDRLPAKSKKKKCRERQYVEARNELCARFPGEDEYQYICKAVAKKMVVKRGLLMGNKSQRKGASGERELAEILQEHGYDCTRGGSLSFGKIPDLIGLPGIHIEVKRVEKLNIMEAMEQAVRDSERMQDGVPAVFHRRNRKPWLVTMRLDDWLELYGK